MIAMVGDDTRAAEVEELGRGSTRIDADQAFEKMQYTEGPEVSRESPEEAVV
jgi:hypothetical protein